MPDREIRQRERKVFRWGGEDPCLPASRERENADVERSGECRHGLEDGQRGGERSKIIPRHAGEGGDRALRGQERLERPRLPESQDAHQRSAEDDRAPENGEQKEAQWREAQCRHFPHSMDVLAWSPA